jgi:hypothetical protein
VKWTERFNFVELVLGDSRLWDDAGTWKISRLNPDGTFGRHPDSQQIIATRIDEIKGHGVGADNAAQFPTYSKAFITVFYEHVPFDIKSDAGLASERERHTSRPSSTSSEVEAFTLPGGNFKFTTAGGAGAHGKVVPFNVSVTRPVRRIPMTWHMLPNALCETGGALHERLYVGVGGDGVPWQGTVNSAPLVLAGLGTFPAGTLLLEGVEDKFLRSPVRATSLSLGTRVDMTFKFAYSPRGWLDLFYFDPVTPANSGWHRVSVDGTHYAVAAMPDGKGLYNVRDFTDLWNPDI